MRFAILCLVCVIGWTGRAEEKAAHAADAKVQQPAPDEVWKNLAEGNKRFVSGKPQVRELVNARKELAKGQHPHAMVLTCADSRVSPELVFDQSLGDLFVVRTAGNIGDKIVLGSMEYAAEHLHSNVLIVLGHEKCGAVGAAASGDKMPSENLEEIVKEIAPAVKEVKNEAGDAKPETLLSKAVAANVELSAYNVLQRSPILKHLVEEGKLRVVKAVYKLETGEVVVLPEPVAAFK